MFHKQRWTLEKIRQRLELIARLVHSKRKPLPSFRYHELETARTLPPIGSEFDDSTWQEIEAYQYWGSWMQNFVLRTTFVIPEDWDKSRPIGLYLPLGEAGDFSHPEALEAIANQLGAEVLLVNSTSFPQPGLVFIAGERSDGFSQLRAGFELESAWETNLLEETESALRVESNAVHLDLRPYQIMTLRLKPK
jgi:glycosyl hydrolase family 38